MANFSYENQGTNTYLVYQIGQDELVDSMSIGMITNNQIPGLAPTVFTQKDTERYVKYNITAKVSVKQFFTGPVNKRRLLGVFNGIVAAMLSAEEYMIDENMIMLDTEYIFADVSTCDTVLICLPLQRESTAIDVGAFFKNIMFNTQFDQTENCDYVARIMNHLNSVPTFSIVRFKNLLDELNGLTMSNVAAKTENNVQKAAPTLNQQPITGKSELPKVAPMPQVNQQQGNLPQKPVVPKTAPMQIPKQEIAQKNIPQTKVPSQNSNSAESEENISLFYLLQHYNSENAAAYKAQKAAKKNGGTGEAVQKNKVSVKPNAVANPKQAESKTPNAGFPIPGQPQSIQQTPNSAGVQPVRPVQPVQPVRPVTPTQSTQPVVPIPSPESTPSNPPVIPRTNTVNFGETVVLGGGVAGETSVLTADYGMKQQVNPRLIRARNNEIIPVNKPGFRIGKEKSYVDYFVSDNTAVSRSHANINSRDGKYYVVDTNSTNHTFVDGRMIPSSTEVEITHGTKLRFANEDFEFKLY